MALDGHRLRRPAAPPSYPPGMDPALLAELHPRLFHMAAARAWPQIARHGLLSTAAILDLAGVPGDAPGADVASYGW